MKALVKLLGEFVAWRWAPAIGLSVASLFYVLVVVALVPDEIGVPVTNPRFAKKLSPQTEEKPEAPTSRNSMAEPESAPEPQAAVAPVQPAGVVDFGRRGFSPPLERPEAPPPPPPPPPPVVAPPPAPVEAPPAVEAPAAVAQDAPKDPVAAAPPMQPPGVRALQGFRNRFPFNRGLVPTPQPPTGQPPGAEPPAGQPPAEQPPAEKPPGTEPPPAPPPPTQ